MFSKNKKIESLVAFLKSSNLNEEAMNLLNLTENKTHLFICDFDGTLFRSPMPPALSRGWWTKPESLNPPYVPEMPGQDWWVSDVLRQARDACADSNTYSVLMTGRQEAVYGDRVRNLLDQQGLDFDFVGLNYAYDTVKFKSEMIEKILSKNPAILTVKILDDRLLYLEKYKELILSINPNIKVEIELVTVVCKGVMTEEVPLDIDSIAIPKKAQYIGLFLTSESKAMLLAMFPALHDKIHADHVTVLFKPSHENLEDLKNNGLLGKIFNIRLKKYFEDESGQALTVEVKGCSFPEGKNPHITVSTNKGVKPVYSNDLIKNVDGKDVEPTVLQGIMWWYV